MSGQQGPIRGHGAMVTTITSMTTKTTITTITKITTVGSYPGPWGNGNIFWSSF